MRTRFIRSPASVTLLAVLSVPGRPQASLAATLPPEVDAWLREVEIGPISLR